MQRHRPRRSSLLSASRKQEPQGFRLRRLSPSRRSAAHGVMGLVVFEGPLPVAQAFLGARGARNPGTARDQTGTALECGPVRRPGTALQAQAKNREPGNGRPKGEVMPQTPVYTQI